MAPFLTQCLYWCCIGTVQDVGIGNYHIIIFVVAPCPLPPICRYYNVGVVEVVGIIEQGFLCFLRFPLASNFRYYDVGVVEVIGTIE